MAEARPVGSLTSVVQDGDQAVAFACENAVGRIEGVMPSVIRLRLSTYGALAEDHSYAIEGELPRCGVTLEDGESEVRVRTGNACLVLDRETLAVSLAVADGAVLSRGLAIERTHDIIIDHRTAVEGEDFYGLGERVSPLGRRGYWVQNWNTDGCRLHDPHTYSSFPFYISANADTGACHGYFLDSSYETRFNMGEQDWDRLDISVLRGELNVYFFTGPSVADIVRAYTELTGRHAMPPAWAVGYHQCRWSYMSTQHAREVAETLRQKKIPCDVMWYDIDYMDSFRVFTFDKSRFGDMNEHAAWMAEQGFKRVVIVDPGVKVDEPGVYNVCDEGTDKGYFVKDTDGKDYVGKVWPGGTKFPDFSRPDVRAWWGQLHKVYYDHGINAFWNDMNEPADGSNRHKTVPRHIRMADSGRWSTMDKMHNVYALLEAKATWEDGMLALRPDDRPFLLSRAAFAGMQKYAAMWGGDNGSHWEYLRSSVAMVMNMGLSGMGFFGADVGGFFGNCTPEMLARWTQVGTFYPFFRNHTCSGTINQEPWRFGEKVEQACRRAIELRYHLLPYVYQLFRDLHQSGAPVMRPMFWHYPEDPKTYALDDQFMFGRYVLAAPVVQRGDRSRKVYLPEGAWYHYLTHERYDGGRDHVIDAPLDSIPVFVRAGAVLPVADNMQTTDHWDRTTLTLEVFPGAHAFEERYYEDDLLTNAYQQGEFCESTIARSNGRLRVSLAEKSSITKVIVRTLGDDGSWGEMAVEGERDVEVG